MYRRSMAPPAAFVVALAVALAGLSAAAPALAAQMPVAPAPHAQPVPQIVTNASEEVEVVPDRAMISFAVETRAKTAAAAGAENARIQTAVLDTLRKLGIAAAQLKTQGVSINPEYEYPQDGGRPTVVGYQARNSIQVEVRKLAQVGSLIDAGLQRGATNVGGLRFFASNVTDARREALKKAVERARADAEVIAIAAGGRLGTVLEIVASPNYDGPIAYDAAPQMLMKAARESAPTPVEAGVLKVSVSVSARFQFVAK